MVVFVSFFVCLCTAQPERNAELLLNQIQYIIHTKLGDGAKRVPESEEPSLLDESGEPRRLSGSTETEQHRKRLRPDQQQLGKGPNAGQTASQLAGS